MKPSSPEYYSTAADNAVPLVLVVENELPSEHLSWLQCCNFTGKLGQSVLIPDKHNTIAIAYVGAGAHRWSQAMANAAKALPQGIYKLATSISQTDKLYWGMAQYQYSRYKKNSEKERVLWVDKKEQAKLQQDLQAIFRVRDLINTPASDMGPEQMAQVIESIAEDHNAFVQQWIGPELLKNNFPAIHAVGRAAAQAPRLIHMQWGDSSNPVIALVGKGVCFDSGGLDIKPADNMRLMKKDMGGAAHAVALAEWIMSKKIPVCLHLLVAAVENAVGPDSYRPGDILCMRNGLTVEVDNTDAEGRLVLADALVKAAEAKPEVIFDFATLTGAARVAVGTDIAAMFCNDDALAKSLAQHAIQTEDPLWRMPLFAAYNTMLDSNIADLLNSAPSSYAGAITAALFLQHFVEKNQRWVHFDIMAWNLNNRPGKPVGGEAMAIRAVGSWLSEQYG